MLGFNDKPVSVDWSYFGGAEELPPSLLPKTSSLPSFTSISASSSRSFSSGQSSSSASSLTSSPKGALTPATSDDDGEGAELSSDEPSDKEGLRNRSGKGSSSGKAAEQQQSSTPPAGAKWMPNVAASPSDGNDFLWLLTEEPHRTRRAAIMKAHPEVKKLMGHEPLTKYISLAVVLIQLSMAATLAHYGVHPLDWRFLLAAYAIGGTANQNIFLAIHEITHNLAFKGIKANKAWAILTNLPIGVPYAMMFKVSQRRF